MLVLSRLVGQTICIGDSITVTVLGAKNGKFRFGVSAPKDVPVHRNEVYQRIIQAEQPRPAKPAA